MYNRQIEFVNTNPLINRSALARAMYPTQKAPQRLLYAKLTGGMISGYRQSMTDKDFDLMEKVLLELSEKINTNIKFNDRKSYFNSDLIL